MMLLFFLFIFSHSSSMILAVNQSKKIAHSKWIQVKYSLMYTCIMNTSSKWLNLNQKRKFLSSFHLCQYINYSPITNANRENFFEWYEDYLLLRTKLCRWSYRTSLSLDQCRNLAYGIYAELAKIQNCYWFLCKAEIMWWIKVADNILTFLLIGITLELKVMNARPITTFWISTGHWILMRNVR